MFLDDTAARRRPNDEQSAAVSARPALLALYTASLAQILLAMVLPTVDEVACLLAPCGPRPLLLVSPWLRGFLSPLQQLFDSSRFNYDSDEEEEEQQAPGTASEAPSQQQQQQQAANGADDAVPAEVPLPPPRGVRVKTAEFIKSSVNVEQCPPPRFPEFAGWQDPC